MKYRFDYTKLRKRIREMCGTQAVFARRLGLSANSMTKRLSSRVPFTYVEMETALQLLEIDWREIRLYFFQEKFTK